MDADSRISALRAESLSYQYGNLRVLTDINLDMARGEIVFLVGANGSGKSTLLRCLAGWTMPKSGVVLLQGKPLIGVDRSLRSRLFFVPDTPSFYDDLTAGEHVEFVLKANRKEECLDNARRLFDAFGLSKHLDQFPSSYSRGMRTKLAAVLALSLCPDVILLDEPFGFLDFRASEVLSAELKKAAENGSCVVLSCHQRIHGFNPSKVFYLHDERVDVGQADDLDRFFMQIPEALSSEPQALNLEARALSSESQALNSELQAQSLEAQALSRQSESP